MKLKKTDKKHIKTLTPATPNNSSLANKIYSDEPQEGDSRSPFQHDKDRILHSTAFRRLQYKTQVYATHEGDLYRTRMTHSLEVSQIARGLAQLLKADTDLTESIALAHDLGHTPFGHAGEYKLKEILKPYNLSFEHNVQSYCVVTSLEERYASHPGLNLTQATLEGLIRHKSYFDNEEDIISSIPENVRDEVTPYLPPVSKQPGIEAQIVNIADTIAYATHDIEDALTIGLIGWDSFQEQVDKLGLEFIKQIVRDNLASDLTKYKQRNLNSSPETLNKMKIRTLSRLMINYLILAAFQQAKCALQNLSTCGPELWLTIRNQDTPIVTFPPMLDKQVGKLVNDLLYKQVYCEPRVKLMAVKAERILETLFQNYMKEPGILPRVTQARLTPYFALTDGQRQDDEAKKFLAQIITDYISGMTDKYAMDTYQLITQAYEKAL